MQAARRVVTLLIIVLALCAVSVPRALAATPGPCQDGVSPSGALSRVCVPSTGWNGELVVFAHGYVPAFQPLGFYQLTLGDGTYLPDLVQSLGFAFATTSYRQNGLAILPAVDDVRELTQAAAGLIGAEPTRTWLVGVSEGGLVTALAVERYPRLFTGAYSTCGPIGNFRFEINYIGDFRVLFDYFFPEVIPGSPVAIPILVQQGWLQVYVPRVIDALQSQPAKALELLRVAHAPFDPNDATTIANMAIGLLSYNVFGANDATLKLGGQPFDNRTRWYSGSSNDVLLNLHVARFRADEPAVDAMKAYTPRARLSVPMVTLHTTGDEIVPFVHELIYGNRVRTRGRGRFIPIPLLRYGHCNFTTPELLSGFALLLQQP